MDWFNSLFNISLFVEIGLLGTLIYFIIKTSTGHIIKKDPVLWAMILNVSTRISNITLTNLDNKLIRQLVYEFENELKSRTRSEKIVAARAVNRLTHNKIQIKYKNNRLMIKKK